MSFFVSNSASAAAGTKIVTLSGAPDLSMIRRADALFIGGTGPYEVDFVSVSQQGNRAIHLVLAIDVAFTDTRCVVVPTSGDFVLATAKMREVSEFGVNVFSSLARWATDEVPTVSIPDAAGTVHNVPTIWFLTSSAGSLIDQNQALKDTVNYLGPLVATLNSNYQALAPQVNQTLISATTLKNDADQAIVDVGVLVSQATQAKNDSQLALSQITPKHNDVSGWYALISGYEVSFTQKHSEAGVSATTASDKALEALGFRNQASGYAGDALGYRNTSFTYRNDAEGFRNAAEGFRNAAEGFKTQSEGFKTAAGTSASDANSAALLAQRWASDPEGVIISSGLYSSRHYMLQAQRYAQDTAANVSGGVSFRGFHNPASGFPVGADVGYQYKLSGSGTLTFEVDGTKNVTAGDYIIKTGTGWVHLDDATDAVKNTRTINGQSLAADVTLNAGHVGARASSWVPSWADVTSKPTTIAGYGLTDAVPSARTVNSKPLTGNISLNAADVLARANTWVPTFAEVASKPTTLSGYGITDAQPSLGFTPIQQGGGTGQGNNKIKMGWANDGSGLMLMVDSTDFGNTLPISITKNAATATKLAAAKTITATGDGTWSVSFDGNQNVSAVFTLSPVAGLTPGTYRSVTVDAKGRVTSGATPTTINGYGITDAVTLAGDQTIAGNKTFSNQLTAGNVVSVQALVSRPFGGEGGQLVLGYANSGAVSSQTNLTWNVDVDSANRLRFFRFDSAGNSLVAMYIRDDTGEATFDFGIRLAALSTSRAPLCILPQAADPLSPVNGDIWQSSHTLYTYLNGVKRTLIHNANPTALASDITQADAEAGTGTGRRWFTAERVAQAIDARAAPKGVTNDRLTALENAPDANETAELALALALLGL